MRWVPGGGRYSQLEREQRWVVDGVPDGATEGAAIVDRYIRATSLRLRWWRDAERDVWKLGQKVRVDPADPERVRLTNMYLPAREAAVLLTLDAAELSKQRWRFPWEGHVVGYDVFGGHLDGLVLAEVELGTDEPHIAPPPGAVRDVTHDDRFSGGSLAALSPTAASDLLAEVRAWR